MMENQQKIPPPSGFHLCWDQTGAAPAFPDISPPAPSEESKLPLGDSGALFRVATWGSTLVASSREGGLRAILHGCLSEPRVGSADDLARLVLPLYSSLSAEKLGLMLRGSFVLVIVDANKGEVILFTDRNGSRKLFYKQDNGQYWIGTTTACLARRTPDPAGIASLLANDFCFLGRTVVQGVSLLDRASIHRIGPNGIHTTCYWMPDYSTKISNASETELEQTYSQLMTQAIRRLVPPTERMLISLSGGIDSRALLGLLSAEPETGHRLTAFTYGEETDDDVAVARELCRAVNIPHRVLRYRGNLAATIRNNGALSEGLVSFYTHGLDGLFTLQDEFQPRDFMFVGDIAFRQGASDFTSVDDMLTFGVGIHAPPAVPNWFGYGNSRPADIAAQLGEDIASLKRKIAPIENLADANHFLLLDQRQHYQILPWREFFTGRFFRVANPLIDEDILDFAAKVPTSYANNKRLHRQTVMKRFPELGKVRFATSGIKNQRAFADISLQQNAISALCDTYESELDHVIPPQVVKAAIIEFIQGSALDRHSLPKTARRLIDSARWKYGSWSLRKSLGSLAAPSPWQGGVPKIAARQLLKLLSLRHFFRLGAET